MLAPHHAEDAQLGQRRLPPQDAHHLLIFVAGKPMLFDDLWGDRQGGRGSHTAKLSHEARMLAATTRSSSSSSIVSGVTHLHLMNQSGDAQETDNQRFS